MLKIHRSPVLAPGGRIEREHVAELQRLPRSEVAGHSIAFDLRDVTLIGRDAVSFLASCEMEGIQLDKCPVYIRDWITAETGGSSREER
jgi:hypothetical protein